MPNWAENRLIVKGKPERVKEFDRRFKGRPALWPLQEFEKYGKSKKEIAELELNRKREWEKQELVYCLNALYPVPKEVLKIGYSVQNSRPLQERLNDLHNPEKWWDGYSWCISHWGTKWDIDGSVEKTYEEEGLVEYYFDTAWVPPCKWVKKVGEDWSDLKFELIFCEIGQGFAGRFAVENGKVVENFFTEDREQMRQFVIENMGFDPYAEFDEPGH
jgi:hypothetical protein